MNEDDRVRARKLLLRRLSAMTDGLMPAWGALHVAMRAREDMLKGLRYMTAMEAEIFVRRELDRGGLAAMGQLLVFDHLTASETDDMAQRAEDAAISLVMDAVSRLRYDVADGVWESTPAKSWLGAQMKYAYQNNQDDPLREKSPSDSNRWLRLLKLAAAKHAGLAYELRGLRRSGSAELCRRNGHGQLRAAAGKDCEYEMFRDKIKSEGLTADLTEVLRGMRM